MANLLESASQIVSSHASQTPMSKEDLLKEIEEVYTKLKAMEEGQVVAPQQQGEETEEEITPVVSRKKAFGKDRVICMICGKEMKTLSRHLRTAHNMTPAEYRDKFQIPKDQPLAARGYSEKRRQMAIDRGLGENLARAREEKRRQK